ncbi:MAG TPA: triose-phosphate isomerase [Candidatus Kapabacteria bacterium]|nr:triose-phosphate isomerase [Candidatus Kapabacteria bacterium]
MRRKIVAGNWKMNTDVASAKTLLRSIVESVKKSAPAADVIVCPPYIALQEAQSILHDSKVALGAQNLHYEDDGAFTGEISATMLKSVGCKYVIIGHSERRQYFGETDGTVNKRIHKALNHELTPIFCVGETLNERQSGKAFDVIHRQVTGGLENISPENMKRIIIAYEPVWAIGTGQNATPAQAEEVHAYIRTILKELFSDAIAQVISILYGGSVKPENAREIFAQQNVDGGLIGGASLKADNFLAIANAF